MQIEENQGKINFRIVEANFGRIYIWSSGIFVYHCTRIYIHTCGIFFLCERVKNDNYDENNADDWFALNVYQINNTY